MTTIVHSQWLRDDRRRRGIIALLLGVFALLSFYPERYRAAVALTPTDPASLGLSSALGQFGAVNSIFGNQTAVEVALRVARSIYVRDAVIDKVNLIKRNGFLSRVAANRWLERNVDIRIQRGGIIEISTRNSDPELAKLIIESFTNATRRRLAEIGKEQTQYKRTVLTELVEETDKRLARAQENYDRFRRRTRYAQPTSAISAIGERIPQLQQLVKAKEVALYAARQFYTDDSLQIRQILAELKALRSQLAEAQTVRPGEKYSVGMVIEESTEARDLERKLFIARALYDNYTRFLEGTSVEDLTQTAVLRVLEPPFVDSTRQINLIPALLGILVLLGGLAVEFYLARPPVGNRQGPLEV